MKPIHASQHLYFASIHRPQAEIFFAFPNGIPITRFIYAMPIRSALVMKKTPSSPLGPEDAIVHYLEAGGKRRCSPDPIGTLNGGTMEPLCAFIHTLGKSVNALMPTGDVTLLV